MSALRLFILRHAKASAASAGQGDFDRPLAERGHAQMKQMGPLIVGQGFVPDAILCSAALRTRETLEGFVPALPAIVPVTLSRKIYEANTESLRSLIAQTAGTTRALMVIGHNPTMHETALGLCGRGERDLLREMLGKFPTAAFAAIEFDANAWSAVEPRSGRLLAFLTPGGAED